MPWDGCFFFLFQPRCLKSKSTLGQFEVCPIFPPHPYRNSELAILNLEESKKLYLGMNLRPTFLDVIRGAVMLGPGGN